MVLLADCCVYVNLCHEWCVQLAYLYASCSELFTSPSGVRRQLLSTTPAHNGVPFICQSWYASRENVNPPAPSAKQTRARTHKYRSRSISSATENCDKKQGLTWNKIDFSKKQYRLLKIAIWDVWKEKGGKLERERPKEKLIRSSVIWCEIHVLLSNLTKTVSLSFFCTLPLKCELQLARLEVCTAMAC